METSHKIKAKIDVFFFFLEQFCQKIKLLIQIFLKGSFVEKFVSKWYLTYYCKLPRFKLVF